MATKQTLDPRPIVGGALTQDPRPIVGGVSVDPAYSGPCGLAVRRWTTGGGHLDVTHVIALPVRSLKLFRWLGDAVCSIVRPGERLQFIAEADAFGGHAVARKLGIAVGIVEGTLVDLNAVPAGDRLDVTTKVWRTILGRARLARVERLKSAKARRKALKDAAIDWAREEFGLELTADAAEALAINEWARRRHEAQ